MPAISITGLFGEKPAARQEPFSVSATRAAGRFADRAAVFADQEHDRIAVGVMVHASDEGVAAFDAMHEAVVAQKIERTIDRDRRRPAALAPTAP